MQLLGWLRWFLVPPTHHGSREPRNNRAQLLPGVAIKMGLAGDRPGLPSLLRELGPGAKLCEFPLLFSRLRVAITPSSLGPGDHKGGVRVQLFGLCSRGGVPF